MCAFSTAQELACGDVSREAAEVNSQGREVVFPAREMTIKPRGGECFAPPGLKGALFS